MEEKQGRNLAGVILNTKIPVETALCRIGRALAPVAERGRTSTLSFPHYSETLQNSIIGIDPVDPTMNFFLIVFLVFFAPLILFLGCYPACSLLAVILSATDTS